MKKLILVSFFLFITISFCFSEYIVSVFPENEQIRTMVADNFTSITVTDTIKEFKQLDKDVKELDVKVVNPSSKFYEDLLTTFDTNYLNYICDKDSIDLLIIPLINKNVQLFVYDRITQKNKFIFEDETRESYHFPLSILSSLLSFFPHKVEKTEIVQIDPSIYEDAINLASQIDRDKITDELDAQYKHSKKKFYQAMSNSLILIGADALARAYLPKDKVNMKAVNIIMQSVVLLSAADTGFRLFQYYKSGKNLVP